MQFTTNRTSLNAGPYGFVLCACAVIAASAAVVGCDSHDPGDYCGQFIPPSCYVLYRPKSATYDATSQTVEIVGVFKPTDTPRYCDAPPTSEIVHMFLLDDPGVCETGWLQYSSYTEISDQEFDERANALQSNEISLTVGTHGTMLIFAAWEEQPFPPPAPHVHCGGVYYNNPGCLYSAGFALACGACD